MATAKLQCDCSPTINSSELGTGIGFTVSTIATESFGANLHLQKRVYKLSENSVTISVKGSVPGKTVDIQAVINPLDCRGTGFCDSIDRCGKFLLFE